MASLRLPPPPAVYQALYLEELTLLDLSEKIALLYSINPQQITHIYRQKPNGIHILVSDEVQHLSVTPLNRCEPLGTRNLVFLLYG